MKTNFEELINKCKTILTKEQKIDFCYTILTKEEKLQLLWLMAEDMMLAVPKVHKDGTKYVDCLELDKEIPIVLNGNYFQFNPEGLYDEDRKKAKLNE